MSRLSLLEGRVRRLDGTSDGGDGVPVAERLDALTLRHNAALDLIGEKEEELIELRADREDVKGVFRGQATRGSAEDQTVGGSGSPRKD